VVNERRITCCLSMDGNVSLLDSAITRRGHKMTFLHKERDRETERERALSKTPGWGADLHSPAILRTGRRERGARVRRRKEEGGGSVGQRASRGTQTRNAPTAAMSKNTSLGASTPEDELPCAAYLVVGRGQRPSFYFRCW